MLPQNFDDILSAFLSNDNLKPFRELTQLLHLTINNSRHSGALCQVFFQTFWDIFWNTRRSAPLAVAATFWQNLNVLLIPGWRWISFCVQIKPGSPLSRLILVIRLSSCNVGVWNKLEFTRPGEQGPPPMRGQYPGHVITLDQSEARRAGAASNMSSYVTSTLQHRPKWAGFHEIFKH